ncbi:MAG: NTP transferase domain-containing protein [Proteobacteria bacterium]|nr:NTP transferase domain-containing protein [Pseudomonadota bacterium]
MINGLSKAVIPAGGLGMRMSGLTRGMPKEMLPVGHRPMIRWCIEEAFQSGIQKIAIILNKKKKSMQDYLACPEIEGPHERERVLQEAEQCRLTFIEQPTPRGSGDAIYLSRAFVGQEPFAVMMPDFLLFGSVPALRQMIEATGQTGKSAVGFLRLSSPEARNFGNVGVLKTEKVKGPIHQVLNLSDKKPGPLMIEEGRQVLKAVGRLILDSGFFEMFADISWNKTAELDDVPVIQRLVEKKSLFGIHLEGHGFDVGNPHGYRAANEYLKMHAHT